MTVVQGTALDAAKAPVPNAQIRITLVTGTAGLPGYTTDGELVAPHTVRADETGVWSVDLPSTNSITPAETHYEFWESGAVSTAQVPDSGGPHQLKDILVTPPPTPAALGITAVKVAVGGTVEGSRPEFNLIPGPGMQIGAVDNAATNSVDVTLTSTGGASPATTIVTEEAYGQAADVGVLGSFAREDHTHGSPDLATTAPHASAPGDAAAVGTDTVPARGDHVHAREAFAAVIALDAFGTASSDGVADTLSRSDHVHGAPALPVASTSAAGIVEIDGTAADIQPLGTQAAGGSGKAADAEHVHPMTGIYSRQVLILCHGLSSSVTPPVGVWTPIYLRNTDTGNFVGWVNQSDGAQNHSISFDFACGAGTFSLELYHLPFNNRGIYTIQVDGVSVGTIDGYATSLSPQRGILTGLVLTAGQHTVTLLMATKNASSSSYVGMVDKILLTRTA